MLVAKQFVWFVIIQAQEAFLDCYISFTNFRKQVQPYNPQHHAQNNNTQHINARKASPSALSESQGKKP